MSLEAKRFRHGPAYEQRVRESFAQQGLLASRGNDRADGGEDL
jgi:hypothetical protein